MPIDGLTPYVHVVDPQRSIDFYRRLGLSVANVHEDHGTLVWAFLTSEADDSNDARARLMIGVRDEQGAGAVDPQTILFYCWSPDVDQLHAELTAAGLRVGPIEHPFDMESGEFQIVDPGGYRVVVGTGPQEVTNSGR